MIEIVVSRILGREPTEDEATLMIKMYDRLGFNGLVAALVYGNEYVGPFGGGKPTSAPA